MAVDEAYVTPLALLRISKYQIPQHGLIPNTTIANKPLIIYHRVFMDDMITSPTVEEHIKAIGVCTPRWRYTMHQTTHFHSTTHELLVMVEGSARLLFGGEENPWHVEEVVQKGDAILIPAGVAHKLVEEQCSRMVGAYPVGADSWDMCYGEDGEHAEEHINKLTWFAKDPLYGENGPATRV